MKEKGVSQYALIKKYNISPARITRLKRNESVSTHTIEMFCKILDCQVGDIMEYIKDDEEWIGRGILPFFLFCFVEFLCGFMLDGFFFHFESEQNIHFRLFSSNSFP